MEGGLGSPLRAPAPLEGALLLLHVTAFQTRSLLWIELIFIFLPDFEFAFFKQIQEAVINVVEYSCIF